MCPQPCSPASPSCAPERVMNVPLQMLTLASAQFLLKSRVRSSAWLGATCGCLAGLAHPRGDTLRLVAVGVAALGPVHALPGALAGKFCNSGQLCPPMLPRFCCFAGASHWAWKQLPGASLGTTSLALTGKEAGVDEYFLAGEFQARTCYTAMALRCSSRDVPRFR